MTGRKEVIHVFVGLQYKEPLVYHQRLYMYQDGSLRPKPVISSDTWWIAKIIFAAKFLYTDFT